MGTSRRSRRRMPESPAIERGFCISPLTAHLPGGGAPLTYPAPTGCVSPAARPGVEGHRPGRPRPGAVTVSATGHGTRTIRFSTDNLGRPLYLTEGRNGMTERPATVAASDELRVRKIHYFAPVSEELLMEYGLIPDTRPVPPPPPWHRRLRWRLTEAVARFRLHLGARIAGVQPEEWEEDGWI